MNSAVSDVLKILSLESEKHLVMMIHKKVRKKLKTQPFDLAVQRFVILLSKLFKYTDITKFKN